MRRSLALSLLLLSAAAGWVGVRGWAAQQDLVAARADIVVARQALTDQDVERARRAVSAAGSATESARERTSDHVWRVAARLPVLGRPLEAVAELTAVADDVARQVLPSALQAAQTVDPKRLRRPDGAVDVTLVVAGQRPLAAAAKAAAQAERRVSAVASTDLSRIDTARDQLREQVAELAELLTAANRTLQVAPALLGVDRPRRYFVLVQQTSESRGTGGLPGGFAVLTADKGRIRVTAQGSNAGLADLAVDPPRGVPDDYVARYGALGAFDTAVNVNLSPDLPVVARVIAARWRAQAGERIDAVVALDGIALSAILRGSGPVVLPDGRRLAPEQLPEYLAVDQYRDFAPRRPADGIDRSQERKDALDTVALRAATRLSEGGGDAPSLLRGLAEAVRSGHLRIASDDPMLAPALRAAEIDGALPPGPAPVAYPVVFNSSGGKLDHFLDRRVTYASGPCAEGRRASQVRLTLTNRAPAAGLPPYLTASIVGGVQRSSLVNRLTVQVFATRGALLGRAQLDGRPLEPGRLVGTTEAGLSVWHVLLELPPGRARTLDLVLDEPAVRGTPRVPEQPLSRPLDSDVRWRACS